MITRRKLLQTSGAALVGAITLPALSEAIQASSKTYQRPKLKITDVRTAMVMVHGPQAHIRIYTDQGLIGQGESTDAADRYSGVDPQLPGALIGKDPLNVDAIWEELRRNVFSGAQGGQYMTALSGLEIALWDLAGKALGLPVYQLLGGKFRDKVRIYFDTDMKDNLGPEADRKVAFAKENGFSVAKIDIDKSPDPNRFDRFNRTANNAEMDRMLREVQHVREKLDAKIELAVDMHAFYDAPTGKRVAKELEPFRLLWLEEPVPPENIEAMAEIKRSTNTPIACGENLYARWGYTGADGEAGGGHHPTRLSKDGRFGGSEKDREPGGCLLHPGRAALCGLAGGIDGFGARVCVLSELPGSRMALGQSSGSLEELGEGRGNHRKRIRHGSGPARPGG